MERQRSEPPRQPVKSEIVDKAVEVATEDFVNASDAINQAAIDWKAGNYGWALVLGFSGTVVYVDALSDVVVPGKAPAKAPLKIAGKKVVRQALETTAEAGAERVLRNAVKSEVGDVAATVAKETAQQGQRIGGAAEEAAKTAAIPSAPAPSDEVLSRLGVDNESASRLGRKAAEAEGAIGVHGVSVTAGTPSAPASTARRSDVEQFFPVHDTPTRRDPLHRTVELPKPMTREAAAIFNQLFGRGASP
jgi:hypothetical protein